MHVRVIALAALVLVGCRPDSDEQVRATLIGQAHLENRESAPAVAAFTTAVELAPDSAAALRNLARAQLLARDAEAATRALEQAAALEPESAATSYLAGLADVRQARFDDAVPHFEDAVRLDPHVAALRFQLAAAYQATGRHAEAREQLAETLRLDSLHTGAVYKLLGYARKDGDEKATERWHRELIRLRGLLGDDGRTVEAQERCVYTLAEAPAPDREAGVEPLPVRFVEATQQLLPPAAAAATAAAIIDVDAEGRPTLLVAGAGGWGVLAPGSGYSPTSLEEPATAVVVGDFQDVVAEDAVFDPLQDARNDVLLLGPEGSLLLRATRGGGWDDVTAGAGLAGFGGRQARWVDADHDGDLDLLAATDEGLRLWRNRGDGRFEDVTSVAGLDGTGPAADVAAADLDGNVAVDLVVARGELPTLVLYNQRTGSFVRRADPPGSWPAARRVLLDDLDHDGHAEAVLVGPEGVTIVPGRGATRPKLGAPGLDLRAAALLDYDNDGWRDLLAGGRGGRLRLWRNAGGGSWVDVTEATGLDGDGLGAVTGVVAADGDGDGDTDLLLSTERGLRFFRNEGGNENAQLKVRLVGTKTNPNGYGARLEARRGRWRVNRVVGELPVEIGLGAGGPLDVLRVEWSNGIRDNTLDVAAGQKPYVLVEKNVAAGSCPFLYAWDATGFRFTTDILGNSPLGLSIRRGVPLDADPDELVRVGALAARDGRYLLTVTEEMREVLYLDAARLVAVDHPPEAEVHPTDKLAPAPFPPSELWVVGKLRPPLRTASDDGVDRTAALSRLDGVYAPPGRPLPPPLRGLTRPLAIELEFPPLPAGRPWVLALTGWLQYGDASTNIAASQGPLGGGRGGAQGATAPVPPRLEVETAPGSFEPLDVVVGMPAGKSKTILVDLAGRVPGGTRRLRLVTSFEIRWDRIALGERLAAQEATRYEARPVSAELYARGFSEIRSRAPGHPTTPEFAAVTPTPPWGTALQGWMTRYGDVLELVAERDERLVLVGAGDAVALAFDSAGFPPLPPDRVRTFFFYSVGWDKDGDLNVIDGDSVEPLPVAASGDWRERFLTRWVPRDAFQD